jgi:L-2-hydroxyglutarate oxidase
VDNKKRVLIVGSGILGNTLAYWLSGIPKINVTVIEKEADTSLHTTSRNTGMIHRPFYMNPEKKAVLAKSASISYHLWKSFAHNFNMPWNEVGTLEVAKTELQVKTLEKYSKWAIQNGIDEKDMALLNREEVKKLERKVSAPGGILSKTDTSTDYGAISGKICEINRKNGVTYLFNTRVEHIYDQKQFIEYSVNGSKQPDKINYDLIINAAGNRSIDLAHQVGIHKDLSILYFRGEYWKLDDDLKGFVEHNIYSVADNPEFPFLDPHLILRPDGSLEIGPNAVPVGGPYSYREGTLRNFEISPLFKRPLLPKVSLFFNSQFLNLAMTEWESSISQRKMIQRINSFIPGMDYRRARTRGFSGIRGSLIDKNGFIPETIVAKTDTSIHILNYNSPGATGAPYFSYLVMKSLQQNGFLVEGQIGSTFSNNIWKNVNEFEYGPELKLF